MKKTRRNILVLGGTGYFGKHLVNMLLDNGDSVHIVSRGVLPVPDGCSFVHIDRDEPSHLQLDGYWDVIYDQSCYSSEHLKCVKNIIPQCGVYVLTSSQAVYPAGEHIDEDSVNYNDINSYKNKINAYGFQKIMSELIVFESSRRCIIPRFPVVIGPNDRRNRIQNLVLQISSGKVELPPNNPRLQLIYETEAARALFELPFKDHVGPINIASEEIITAENLCYQIAEIVGVNLKIDWKVGLNSSAFDLIKREPKTLSLKKQKSMNINIRNYFTFLREIVDSVNGLTTGALSNVVN